jgi:hypothetical protein
VSRIYLTLLLGFLAVALYGWANDKITREGERTIYTVDCVQGTWESDRCMGRLIPAQRFRFRALKARQEVLFWTVGEQAPSSKYTACSIKDGHNWSCKPDADTSRTITHEMLQSRPVRDPTVQMVQFHQVPKWRWFLLRIGVPAGRTAT